MAIAGSFTPCLDICSRVRDFALDGRKKDAENTERYRRVAEKYRKVTTWVKQKWIQAVPAGDASRYQIKPLLLRRIRPYARSNVSLVLRLLLHKRRSVDRLDDSITYIIHIASIPREGFIWCSLLNDTVVSGSSIDAI